jgi:hypothetical protein
LWRHPLPLHLHPRVDQCNTASRRPVFLGAFAKLRRATITFFLSVRPSSWNNSAHTGRIYMKCNISVFFVSLLRNVKFH